MNKDILINPITIEEVAKYILDNIRSRKRIHEIGSIDKFRLNTLKKILGSKSKFGTKKIKLTSQRNDLIKFNSKKLINQMKKMIRKQN